MRDLQSIILHNLNEQSVIEQIHCWLLVNIKFLVNVSYFFLINNCTFGPFPKLFKSSLKNGLSFSYPLFH